MNIRNVSQLKSAHYDGVSPNNVTHLIASPGVNKSIAIYVVSNWSGATVKITDADDASDSAGLIRFACKDGMITLDAPVVLPPNKGVTVDQSGVTILYTVINTSVAGGAY